MEGAWFYEKQNAGLGDFFIDRVEFELSRLLVSYGIHERMFGFHRKLVERFPFAIYYLVADNVIDVVAILDCRRDPVDFENRLRSS